MTSRSSLVNRIAIVISAIVLTSVVSMATTLAVSHSIEGNATAINQAGALRLGAFELLTLATNASAQRTRPLQAAVDNYRARLSRTSMTRTIPTPVDHPLALQHQKMLDTWRSDLEPALLSHPLGRPVSSSLLGATENYVAEVDELVSLLEQRTEARVNLLHVIQVISLIFSVLIVVVLFLDLKNRVLQPLRKLVGIANATGNKDFTLRANLDGDDELSRLGQAFDQMTAELAQSYQALESEARHKTRELEKSHKALEILHNASRTLFANHDLCAGAVPMLQQLESLLGIGPIRLYLHDRHATEPVEAVVTATPERPFYCRDHHCTACLVTPEVYDDLPVEGNDGRRLMLPIRTPGQLLGTLEVWYPASTGLSDTSRQLLETLSDQLATAIFLDKQITEEQQLTLAEERAVIARELHDSLAQSLSYLKMQVARLRRLEISGEQQQTHSAILDELSNGLNSAYRQLRELLTTFRLKLDTPDLLTALRETAGEFSERLGQPVHLHYNLPLNTLSPNEEIHTLQIVREALANAVKHADATEVTVEVLFESPQVKVRILDNGKGLPDDDRPPQHYGLIIIQDRARTLGGQAVIRNRDSGGVEVTLNFVPKSRHTIFTQVSAS